MPGLVLHHMGKGAGIKELAHYLRVSRQTVYDWCDPGSKQYHRRFAEAIALGRELSESWWMRFGRLAAQGQIAAASGSLSLSPVIS